jgi:hypothetical protein
MTWRHFSKQPVWGTTSGNTATVYGKFKGFYGDRTGDNKATRSLSPI